MSSAKPCTSCGTVKPLASFPDNRKMLDGKSSHCRACCLEKRRKWAAVNGRAAEAAQTQLKSRYPDALVYSRSVCDHVASYVGRAIERFERKTGDEAPPHLTSILSLARSIADEHPEDLPSRAATYARNWRERDPEAWKRYRQRQREKYAQSHPGTWKTCGNPECDIEIYGIGTSKYCSRKCKDHERYLRQKETPGYAERKREKNRKYVAGRREREPGWKSSRSPTSKSGAGD